MTVFDTLFVAVQVAAGIWIGAIVFQSFVVAPTVFGSLDETSARRFLRAIFPRFYRLGIACGIVMLAAILGAGVMRGWPFTLLAVATITGVMLLAQVVSLRMVPAINAARDAGTEGRARFARLHGLSVGLTLLVLLLGVCAVALVPGASAAV